MKDEGPPLDTFSASVAHISVLAAGDEEWMNGDSGRWEATSLRAAWSRVHDRTLCHVTRSRTRHLPERERSRERRWSMCVATRLNPKWK